jgi:hypothetical protein
MKSNEVHVNERGGKQSKLDVRYDLLSPTAIKALAQVLAYGAEKYDPWNWTKIDTKDHVNHAMNHIIEYLAGNEDEHFPQLYHALCRMMFAVHMLIAEQDIKFKVNVDTKRFEEAAQIITDVIKAAAQRVK